MLGLIGTVVSGDKIVKDLKTLRWLQREFSALATEMEGAAVGYTCGLSNVRLSSFAASPTAPVRPRIRTLRRTFQKPAITATGSSMSS